MFFINFCRIYVDIIFPVITAKFYDILFICDNMLWSGRVADAERQDDDTRGVRELTRLLCADTDLATTILPLRDGVSLSLKAS